MKFSLSTLLVCLSLTSFAQNELEQKGTFIPPQAADTNKRFNLHFQTTYIYQYKPSFNSPYEGENSLKGEKEKQNSLTATLFLGVRLWKGASVYVNPEIAGGSGLSGALGMGGSSNGETTRVGDPAPTLYLGRGFLQQIIAIGKEREYEEDAINQLPYMRPTEYLRFAVGKYSLGDIFDNNEYSNSPRTQFMNWALMNNGAWDYAANVRGYTYAFTAELRKNSTNYKLAMATLPTVANGSELSLKLNQSYSLNAEVDRDLSIHGKEGHIRLLAFYNHAFMGNYKDAINNVGIADTPDIISTRTKERGKFGLGLNIDQQLTDDIGIFGRIGWNDGKNETWAFTEIDHTASVGLSIAGKKWKRQDDVVGVALLADGLSTGHREYLAKGGNGFMLGDGKLNYAPECIGELYYNLKPTNLPIWITGDYQLAFNPGYNRDRGPVNIFSVRVHVEI